MARLSKQSVDPVSEYSSFTLHVPKNWGRYPEDAQPITYSYFCAYKLTKGWFELIPDLKKFISEWHLILGDVVLLPFNFHSWREIEIGLEPYFHKRVKGAIFFYNASIVVVLR